MKQQIIETVKPVMKSMFDDKEKRCPKCGHVGPVLEDFGTRLMHGKSQAQSWCLKCRKAEAKERHAGFKSGDVVEISGVIGKPGRRCPPLLQEFGWVSQIGVYPEKPGMAALPADTESLRRLYREHYPNDNHKRGPKIMRERLGKKLGRQS